MIKPEQLAEWKRLAEEATPGPWRCECEPDYGHYVHAAPGTPTFTGGDMSGTLITGEFGDSGETLGEADSHFIAAARTAVPALVAEVERLREIETAAREFERDVHVSAGWDERREKLRAALGGEG